VFHTIMQIAGVVVVVLACVLSGSFLIAPTDAFGDRLLRTYFLFSPQPTTMNDAIAQGWNNVSSGCDPNYGIRFSNPYGISHYNPTFLHFTSAGQLAGFGIRVWGDVPSQLLDAGLWNPAPDVSGANDIYLSTRASGLMCSGRTDATQVVGDRLLINGIFPIQLNSTSAKSNGWVEGRCLYQMGSHYAYDLNAPGNQTWNPTSLVPVLPMYSPSTGNINAILFNVWNLQWTEPLGVFEGPFPNGLFCANWCKDTGCTFEGVSVWSTLHWHFVDPSTISCTGARCQ